MLLSWISTLITASFRCGRLNRLGRTSPPWWGLGRRSRSLDYRKGQLAPIFLEQLEDRHLLTAFTEISPTSLGLLPDVTPVGGVVLDLIGVSGKRVVSQLRAGDLFQGYFHQGTPEEFEGNPGTIGIQPGFTEEIIAALGGGLAEVAVRLTIFDGDTGPGDFDDGQNRLLLNGISLGTSNGVDLSDFSNVITEETDPGGQTTLSVNSQGGFRDDRLDTGFFYSTNAAFLESFYQSLVDTGQVVFQLGDFDFDDPNNNRFDFTQGIDGGLVSTGQLPLVTNQVPQIGEITRTEPAIEGRQVTVTVEATDPDAEDALLTYEFDFDNNGAFEISGASPSASTTYDDDGTYQINIRVIDHEGGAITESVAIEIIEALDDLFTTEVVEILPPVVVESELPTGGDSLGPPLFPTIPDLLFGPSEEAVGSPLGIAVGPVEPSSASSGELLLDTLRRTDPVFDQIPSPAGLPVVQKERPAIRDFLLPPYDATTAEAIALANLELEGLNPTRSLDPKEAILSSWPEPLPMDSPKQILDTETAQVELAALSPPSPTAAASGAAANGGQGGSLEQEEAQRTRIGPVARLTVIVLAVVLYRRHAHSRFRPLTLARRRRRRTTRVPENDS